MFITISNFQTQQPAGDWPTSTRLIRQGWTFSIDLLLFQSASFLLHTHIDSCKHKARKASLTMTVETIVTDHSLQPLLRAAKQTLAQTQSMIDWLLDNGTSNPPSSELQQQLAQQQKLLHVYLAKLRGLHRKSAFGARATKQQTAEARQEVDRLLLQLQNLYYEQKHLLGEISACESYDHSYMRLPLLSHDEFVALFPDSAGLSEEELMPQRIEHEKQEREKMEQERLRLEKIKDDLVKENTRRKDESKKVDEKLENMVDGMQPLQEMLAKDL